MSMAGTDSRFILGSDNNTLNDNTASGNGAHGIALSVSAHNHFHGNVANANVLNGFSFADSDSNLLEENTFKQKWVRRNRPPTLVE